MYVAVSPTELDLDKPIIKYKKLHVVYLKLYKLQL